MAQLTASIHVRGLKELDAALAKLTDEVTERIMGQALAAAGEVIRRAAADNIDSRTGRTAADIRMEIQQPAPTEGVAAIGGTVRGTTGRAHVLRWLEFGTRSASKPIVAGARARRVLKTKIRRAIRNRDIESAITLAKGAKIKRALALPWGLRASAKHRGIKPEAPLTRALAEHGDRALKVFRDTLWAGIVATAQRVRKAA